MERNRRIVLADASWECLTLLKTALTATGDHTVHLSRSGEEALRQIWRFDPDLVVMDTLLPGMSALEVLRHLHRSPETMPRVLCLASTTCLTVHEQVLELGARLLYKPITVSLLLQELQRLSPHRAGQGP